MRTFIITLILATAALNPAFTAPARAAESRAYETVTLDIPGMTCQFCPITIRKALEKVDGVIEAKASFDTKTATVTFDPAKTNVEALTKATAEAGYPSTPRQ